MAPASVHQGQLQITRWSWPVAPWRKGKRLAHFGLHHRQLSVLPFVNAWVIAVSLLLQSVRHTRRPWLLLHQIAKRSIRHILEQENPVISICYEWHPFLIGLMVSSGDATRQSTYLTLANKKSWCAFTQTWIKRPYSMPFRYLQRARSINSKRIRVNAE